ncbi:MAG: hypothetical protein J5752_08785 [Clostridiales bacterium]|nr:hypothetical protein [Clostridiales bacterium]
MQCITFDFAGQWNKRSLYKFLNIWPGDEPKAVFAVLSGAEIIRAYKYCNLHGFWVSEG